MSVGLSDQGPICNQEGPFWSHRSRSGITYKKKSFDAMREKNAYDWILTWSPEEGCEEIPPRIKTFLEDSACVAKAFAIAEYSNKWHIHVGFRLTRSFNSDYAWWNKGLFDPKTEKIFVKPALDIRYHDNLLGLVGGYCSKSTGTRVLLNINFSREELELGKTIYTKGLIKQRIRKNLARYHVIGKEKYAVAVGSAMHEFNCGEAQAPLLLAGIGYAFSSSCTGLERIYKADYVSWLQTRPDIQAQPERPLDE